MDLHKIKDEDKIKAFDMIIDTYNLDSSLSEFGSGVQRIILFLKEMFKFRGNKDVIWDENYTVHY